jgi:glycosyltransferase involved in cell wall biosynthesis
MCLNKIAKRTLSVGVPTFNQGEYLRATLDSLLSQTIAPLEIVVSDNHSTDETADILREYQGKVRVIKPKVHLDMMAHWNFLVSNLNGEWFALLSSDDIAKPNYVEILLKGIDRSDAAVLVRCGWETIDSEGRFLDEHHLLSVKAITSPPATFYDQLQGPKVSFAAFAVRKSAWKNVGGYPEECTLAGDWGFWLKISPYGDFVLELEIISQYRTSYRPVLQKKRIVAWLKDEFIISTAIIPRAAKQMPSANQRLIDKARKKRITQCIKLASQYLDASDRYDAISVFETWARELGLSLSLNKNWGKFTSGKKIQDVDFLKHIKTKYRKVYSWLRQLNNA